MGEIRKEPGCTVLRMAACLRRRGHRHEHTLEEREAHTEGAVCPATRQHECAGQSDQVHDCRTCACILFSANLSYVCITAYTSTLFCSESLQAELTLFKGNTFYHEVTGLKHGAAALAGCTFCPTPSTWIPCWWTWTNPRSGQSAQRGHQVLLS